MQENHLGKYIKIKSTQPIKLKMKYDLEKLHSEKHPYERGNGKSVDAIFDVIGKIMATENDVVPFVVERLEWHRHLAPIFIDVCHNHFNETPEVKKFGYFSIKGYSTICKLIQRDDKDGLRGLHIEPTFDIL